MKSDSVEHYLEDRLQRIEPALAVTRLFIPEAGRRRFAAQRVLLFELTELVGIRETGVATTKLAWWYEEWKRLHAGEPRHPVTRALALDQAGDAVPWPSLDGALSVVASQIAAEPPANEQELAKWLDELASALSALELRADGASPAQPAWRQLVLAEWMLHLARWAELDRAPWSLDLAARCQLSTAQLRRDPGLTEGRRALWRAFGVDRLPRGTAAATSFTVLRRTRLRELLGEGNGAGRWGTLISAWRARAL